MSFCLFHSISPPSALTSIFLGAGGVGIHGWADSRLIRTPSLRQLACECYSRLPSLGAGFSQGLKHTDSWEQELRSLLASLHSLLGGLYEGAEAGRARPADALGRGMRGPEGAVRGPGETGPEKWGR